MIQPSASSGRATADEEVCRPRPVTGLTSLTARKAAGTSAFTSVDLPTPEWPTSTLTWPVSRARTSSSGPPAGHDGGTPSGAYASSR